MLQRNPISEVPTRLWWALGLITVFHGSLLISGSYRGTYDAFVHIFLADHYARDWFSTWDTRWYTGFTTVSYPPGGHQAVGAISKVIGDLGYAFVVVQLAALLLLCVGVYRFSRLWVQPQTAATAALMFALSSSISETVHVFGQLPTTFALSFLLNAAPFLNRWAFEGRFLDLGRGVIVLAACTAGHHVTTLFGSVFFLGPVLLAGLIEVGRRPHPLEIPTGHVAISRQTIWPLTARLTRRVLPSMIRLAVLGPAVLMALVVVVLPYWIWSGSDPILQVPIPHGSRANFLIERNVGLVFFVIPWGLLIVLLPLALIRGFSDRRWPLAASVLLLAILGTGGTTPIPRLLLGPAFNILTLDRFTFWATIAVLPLAALVVESAQSRSIRHWLHATGGRILARGVLAAGAVGYMLFAVLAANLGQFRSFQPDPIDPTPIVAFMEKDQHFRWRFLTLGFGDQMAWLSAQTTATQVDGNYHSVRRLPELTTTGVERLEGAKYRGVAGLGSLQQFLEIPDKYNLKFVFSNDKFYDPLLYVSGWENIGVLENGVVMWQRADVPPLPAVLVTKEKPAWQRVMWGTVPPFALLSALAVLLASATLARWLDALPAPDPGRPRGLLGPVDRWLGRQAKRLPPGSGGLRPKPAPLVTLRRWARRKPRPSGRGRRVALVAIALLASVLLTLDSDEPSPADTVEAYYDHLDFRRFAEAYALLDPEARAPYEQWRTALSTTGGLIASYAKLDQITTEAERANGNQADVHTSLRYLTALNWYDTERTHTLIRRNGQWFLEPDPIDVQLPPNRLERIAVVDFHSAGRRRVLSGTTELIDVDDRPTLDVTQARLVEYDGHPVVVGHVINTDADPADLSISAILRDSKGAELARYNMTEHGLRTLNPGEATAFRIDFEEVAAGSDVDFDPLQFQPIQTSADIATVELYARGTITTANLLRPVNVEALRAVESPGGLHLSARVRNPTTIEAIVPVIFTTYLDETNHVLWMDRHYLEASLRPQRWRDIELLADVPNDITPIDAEVIVYDNGQRRTIVEVPQTTVGTLPIDGSGYDAIAVTATAMTTE